jgi:hypothetical protein
VLEESGDFDVPMDDYTGIITATYNSVENGTDYYDMSVDVLPDHSIPNSTSQCLMPAGQIYKNIGDIEVNGVTLNGATMSDDYILSGFSSSNYASLDTAFPSSITQFKMIMKANTGSGLTSHHNTLLGRKTSSEATYIIRSTTQAFSTYQSGWIDGTNALSANTDYWFKVELVNGSYIGYTAEDDGYTIDDVEERATWRQEWATTNSAIAGLQANIGYNSNSTGEYFGGTIDLKNSLITCNDSVYLSAQRKGMDGIFYNYTDDGSEQTLNCFYDGSKYLLSPDYSIGSYTYLGTVTIPEHDLWKYDDGTWTKQYRAFVWRDIDDDGNLTLATGEFPADTFKGVAKIDTGALNSAFSGCTDLTGSVTFPDLVEVGNAGLQSAFSGCSGLTSAYFPLLITVGEYGLYGMFEDCTSLTEIHFSASAESVIKSADGYDEKFGATNATIYFDL